MIRRALAGLFVVLAASGCHLFGPDPLAPSLPPVFGARVTDGQLRLWTGTPCTQVDRVAVRFAPDGTQLVWEPPANRVADIEYLTLEGPNPGLDIVEPLPDDFDWRTSETVDLWLDPEHGAGSTPTDLTEVMEASADHPEDTYYFQGIGWLNAAQVSERNRTSLLTVCTPDPAKEPSLPAAFGARVTDGTLRIWTGSPCTSAYGVTLVFQPDDPTAAEIPIELYTPDNSTVDIERLTFGDPSSGLGLSQPLPSGFDWRTMQSLTLQIHRPELHREATTQLSEVVNGSASHPENTYYFDGIGWLSPAQVAEQDGKTFLGPCTADPKE